MKSQNSIYFFLLDFIIFAALFQSCSSKGGGGGVPNPCTGITIIVTGTTNNTSGAGINDGSISASATGSSGFTFSINGGAFQSSGNFTGLAAGSYTVTAKNSNSCTGSASFTINANDPCTTVTFSVGVTPVSATPCATTPNGSITITTSGGGSGFTFNINGGAFQASPTFNNLTANTFTVGAKEAGGCIKTTSVTVASTLPGSLFSAVKTIIQANCAVPGCHVSPAPTGGIDFTIDCNIVANRDRIKERAVNNFGTVNQMPPPPTAGLSQANRDAIVNWINAGGQFGN